MTRPTVPPPKPARSRAFWNFMAPRYARQPVADEAAYQHKLALTQALLTKEMRVLEFGCGTGTTALIHAPHVAEIDGIDYSSKMVEIASGKAAEAKVENVRFHQASIEDWPIPDRPYDAVMGMSILHLVLDRHAVLGRVRQMLAPGGLFFSSTVCVGDMPGVLPRVLLPIASALRIIPKIGRLSATSLETEITQAGFEIVQTWRPGPDKSVFIVTRAV
ncbi:class I SAM-dependent methyltransferase [Flavimaricola marinus]|uniref:Putative methyltransferase YcgJ n=1 Tax=Flavimaricola marinus TaxID=1819565 RepID=A0A238LGH5_9RHOB|nr:class I SAM-dependent methyltransferase [Flavimaricola marinus]SMY08515.1 putative methyltransferase YcgJ [Flavimaricola marinus]